MRKKELYKFHEFDLIKVNLQLFADEDKTEKATPKKREDARKKGQVYQSRELSAAVLLLGVVLGLKMFGSFMYQNLEFFFKRVFLAYTIKNNPFEINDMGQLYYDLMVTALKVIGPLLAVVLFVILGTQVAQVGFLFTTETLGVKFEKINPLSGAKRIFSVNSLAELLKAILKIILVGLIVYQYLQKESKTIISLMEMDVMDASMLVMDITISVALRMAFALLILGIGDFIYQWWQYEKNLKMSKKEIKDEYKQQEGNPEVKSKIKQKQRQISMRRMMQEIPKADVVITNPTHYAVAVKYDPKKSEAPFVLAKGMDYIALRMKEVAKENKVQIVENKPLARALYETVDVGKSIPAELYQAVAEVLAFVYSLKGKSSA